MHGSVGKQRLPSLISRLVHTEMRSAGGWPPMAHSPSWLHGSSGTALHSIGAAIPHMQPHPGAFHVVMDDLGDAFDPATGPHSMLHASLGPLSPPMQNQGMPYDEEHEHRFPAWVMQRPPMAQSGKHSSSAGFTNEYATDVVRGYADTTLSTWWYEA